MLKASVINKYSSPSPWSTRFLLLLISLKVWTPKIKKNKNADYSVFFWEIHLQGKVKSRKKNRGIHFFIFLIRIFKNTQIMAIKQLLRVSNWMKNIFVLAPLIYSMKMFDLLSIENSIIAFFTFCLTGSALYIINDIKDKEETHGF